MSEANDICPVCEKAIAVPEFAFRCEHGGCTFGYSHDGHTLVIALVHQCGACMTETHRYSAAQLLQRALDREPTVPSREQRDRWVAEANAK